MSHKFRWPTSNTVKWIALAGIFVLQSCTETRYVDFDSVQTVYRYPYRTVAYEINREFFGHFPDCVLILPPKPSTVSRELSSIIETALARHLERKFNRVIDAMERNILAERLNIEMADDQSSDLLARELECDAYLESEIFNPQIKYLLVWSQIGLGLNFRLQSTSSGKLIWHARHEARRSEGGVSFSPLGALLDSALSTRFVSDREAAEGIVDDAVRRMILPLPNLRTY
jgi:hypothetical protein